MGRSLRAGGDLGDLLAGRLCRDFRPKKKDVLLTVIEDEIVPIERRGVAPPPPPAEVINRSIRREPRRRSPTAAEMNAARGRTCPA